MTHPIGRSGPAAVRLPPEPDARTTRGAFTDDWRSGMAPARPPSAASCGQAPDTTYAGRFVPYLGCYDLHGDVGPVIADSLEHLKKQAPEIC
jgi:hypothetical protein